MASRAAAASSVTSSVAGTFVDLPYRAPVAAGRREPSLLVERERDGAYDAAAADRGSAPGSDIARVVSLEAAVASLRSVGVDELSERELVEELAVLERVCRQLSARQSRVVAALGARRSRRARDAARAVGRAEDTAAQRASRELGRELSDELGWSPAESKRRLELGRRLDGGGEAGRAFDAGELSGRHAAVLADTLRHVGDPVTHQRAQSELVALARVQEPVEFGRSCRRWLARVDAGAAEEADVRRRIRRSARCGSVRTG